jgi:hypothetical protein
MQTPPRDTFPGKNIALSRGAAGKKWSRRLDSNPQPPVYKTGALPLSYTGEARIAQRK